MLRFRITGTSEIAKALQGLPSSVGRDVAMDAMTQAVEPLVAAARALVPVGETGGLKASLGFAVRQYKNGRVTFGVIGARRGFGVDNPGSKSGRTEPANYAHLVEYGHAIDGDAVGWVDAKPFLRPAWGATKGRVALILGEELKSGIAIAATRRKRRITKSATA